MVIFKALAVASMAAMEAETRRIMTVLAQVDSDCSKGRQFIRLRKTRRLRVKSRKVVERREEIAMDGRESPSYIDNATGLHNASCDAMREILHP